MCPICMREHLWACLYCCCNVLGGKATKVFKELSSIYTEEAMRYPPLPLVTSLCFSMLKRRHRADFWWFWSMVLLLNCNTQASLLKPRQPYSSCLMAPIQVKILGWYYREMVPRIFSRVPHRWSWSFSATAQAAISCSVSWHMPNHRILKYLH